MKLVIEARTLYEGIRTARAGMGRGTKDHTKVIQLTAQDGMLSISAQDGNTYRQVDIPCDGVEAAGTQLWGWGWAVALLKKLKGLIVVEDGLITAHTADYRIEAVDLEWPTPESIPFALSLDAPTVKAGLAKLSQSTGGIGTGLEQVFVIPGHPTTLAASNGHLLVSVSCPGRGEAEGVGALPPTLKVGDAVGDLEIGWVSHDWHVATAIKTNVRLWRRGPVVVTTTWIEQTRIDPDRVSAIQRHITPPINTCTISQRALHRALEIGTYYNPSSQDTAIHLSFTPETGMIAEYSDPETGEMHCPLPTASTSLAPWAGHWSAEILLKVIGKTDQPVTIWHTMAGTEDKPLGLLNWEVGGIRYLLAAIKTPQSRKATAPTLARPFRVIDGAILLAASNKLLKPAAALIPDNAGTIWLTKAQLKALYQAPTSQVWDREPARSAA